MIRLQVGWGQQMDHISHLFPQDGKLGVACHYLSVCVSIFRLWPQVLESFIALSVFSRPGGGCREEG